MNVERPGIETILLEVIQALRDNPDKYWGTRRALTEAATDEERVRALLNFATDERELAALMPAAAREAVGDEELFPTTVTVTTVLIPNC